MKLAITLCVLCLMLLAAVLAFAWAADKLQIGPWRKETPSPVGILNQQQALYASYCADYENFAQLVWRCLYDSATALKLECPKASLGIYEQNKVNRISQLNNSIVFRYEIPKIVSGLSGREFYSAKDQQIWLRSIEDHLQGHLGDYLDKGYTYSGHITAWNSGNNLVRIEVHGISRQNYVGEIQI